MNNAFIKILKSLCPTLLAALSLYDFLSGRWEQGATLLVFFISNFFLDYSVKKEQKLLNKICFYTIMLKSVTSLLKIEDQKIINSYLSCGEKINEDILLPWELPYDLTDYLKRVSDETQKDPFLQNERKIM